MPISRRRILASAALALPAAAQSPSTGRLKIVVAGGHPGDPECGCGGTIARYTSLGHDVVALYLNRGEGFCSRPDTLQCAAIRTAEAEKACRILNCRAAFMGQIDGRATVDNQRYDDAAHIFDVEKPDIVFSHWPIDKHRDHRALATLILDAWLRGNRKFALYFYEVYDDTMMFSPTDFVDISNVESARHAACYAHASQQPDKWYPGQVTLTKFRGAASGFPQAEAFTRHWESRRAFLP